MVPKDLPHPFLKVKIVAVKEPHPPLTWAALRLVQNSWAVGEATDVGTAKEAL